MNGWSNAETWRMVVGIDNHEPSYSAAKKILKDSRGPDGKYCRRTVSAALRDRFGGTSVRWPEIAEAWIADREAFEASAAGEEVGA